MLILASTLGYTATMNVTAIESVGTSAKFQVVTKNGSFKLALSNTLRTKIWKLESQESVLDAAQELAEAIVSRHNHAFAFRELYVFAEHNTAPTLVKTVAELRKFGF